MTLWRRHFVARYVVCITLLTHQHCNVNCICIFPTQIKWQTIAFHVMNETAKSRAWKSFFHLHAHSFTHVPRWRWVHKLLIFLSLFHKHSVFFTFVLYLMCVLFFSQNNCGGKKFTLPTTFTLYTYKEKNYLYFQLRSMIVYCIYDILLLKAWSPYVR